MADKLVAGAGCPTAGVLRALRPAEPPGRDYSPILPGAGKDDYARYMNPDLLLSLQRAPASMLHRDELLFQIVHQSTELWLKLACFEVAEATRLIESGELAMA